MSSSAPPRPHREALPERPNPRLLVGADLGAAQRWDAPNGMVEVQTDVSVLIRRAGDPDVWLVIVAGELPGIERLQLAAKSRAWPPVIVLSSTEAVRAHVTRMLGLLRLPLPNDPSDLFRRVLVMAAKAIAMVVDGRSHSDDALSESVHVEGDPMAALVRPRTPGQDREVKRLALEASFKERARLLEGSLTTSEVASLLGVSRQTPHDRVKARALLAIEDKGALRFPMWQFDAASAGGVVAGLEDVLRALKVGALAQARWLERQNPVFEGRSPIDVLKAGEVERVVREARAAGATGG